MVPYVSRCLTSSTGLERASAVVPTVRSFLSAPEAELMDTAQAFRSCYGRLCSLSAQALHSGFHSHAVYLASVGKNQAKDAQLQAINDQHDRLDESIRACREFGLTTVDLVPIARDVKAAVESEWQCSIPLYSDLPKTSG